MIFFSYIHLYSFVKFIYKTYFIWSTSFLQFYDLKKGKAVLLYSIRLKTLKFLWLFDLLDSGVLMEKFLRSVPHERKKSNKLLAFGGSTKAKVATQETRLEMSEREKWVGDRSHFAVLFSSETCPSTWPVPCIGYHVVKGGSRTF